MRMTINVVRVEVVRLSRRASFTAGSFMDRSTASGEFLRKRDAIGKAMKAMVRQMTKAIAAFRAISLKRSVLELQES
jgi:hypothetical protein